MLISAEKTILQELQVTFPLSTICFHLPLPCMEEQRLATGAR